VQNEASVGDGAGSGGSALWELWRFDVGGRDLSGQTVQPCDDGFDFGGRKLTAALVDGHLAYGTVECGDGAVVEVRPGLTNIAQRRNLEDKAVGVLIGDLSAACIGFVGPGLGDAKPLEAVAADVGAVVTSGAARRYKPVEAGFFVVA